MRTLLRSWHQFWYLQDDKSATCFLLHCQKFIELVRVCLSPVYLPISSILLKVMAWIWIIHFTYNWNNEGRSCILVSIQCWSLEGKPVTDDYEHGLTGCYFQVLPKVAQFKIATATWFIPLAFTTGMQVFVLLWKKKLISYMNINSTYR
jgi:hypothetical protein